MIHKQMSFAVNRNWQEASTSAVNHSCICDLLIARTGQLVCLVLSTTRNPKPNPQKNLCLVHKVGSLGVHMGSSLRAGSPAVPPRPTSLKPIN